MDVSFLRNGRKKEFVPKNFHTEVSKLEFREMVALAKFSIEKTKSIIYERYKLFTRRQESRIHAALTAQARKAELGILEN